MDPRRSRSRAKLKAALKDLLAEKRIEEVRVDELCQRAGVTRPTFYANFGEVHALLDDHLEALVLDLRDQIIRHAPDPGPLLSAEEKHRRATIVLTWLFQQIGTDDPLIRRLLIDGEATRVERPFIGLFDTILRENREAAPGRPHVSDAHRDVGVHFFTGAIMSLLRLWLQEPGRMTAADLAAIGAHFMTYGRSRPPLIED
ncbi:TetR/AcrR family transcriptional regulator [Pelagovum pacificum]|uniref:TetR/AcrR family transcriptional regulator n=1 Tax=Pelagovum pacificum TaxID=2588711 RepID=A0A5C5GE48_9RHOB|nr:TetR/AcrR family transcriptional regulator [Pelagovum pacificum]QQA43891.1 TetR/AcrR family transcriptional regulator [Pelagovum pacificum]TNY32978.1 TetR/AcrR family transcriptional regulator [Pelagovum pacificum]